MATALLEAAQALREAAERHDARSHRASQGLACGATLSAPDEHRIEQLRNCAQRSIKVVFHSSEHRRGAAVLLRDVTADAVVRTSQFFSKFGEVQSARRRQRNGSLNGECDVAILFATDEPAERFVEYAAREGMSVEIQRTASSACGKRTRNDFTEPECAHWLSEMVNDSPAPKRSPTHNAGGRESLLRELDGITPQGGTAAVSSKAQSETTKQQVRQRKQLPQQGHQGVPLSNDGKVIKRKRILLEQPGRPPAIATDINADLAEQASAKAEFMDAVKEEHARSIVHPVNWGLSANAAREAAAAAEAAVANMRAGLDISLEDMSLDCASEYDDIANATLSNAERADSILAGHCAYQYLHTRDTKFHASGGCHASGSCEVV